MALIHDILDWTTTLPKWQRDAARRLFSTELNLNENDYDELFLLLKKEMGLQKTISLQPIPLSSEHLPAPGSADDKIILKSMRELKNVNKIPTDQILSFHRKGLTVIYGGNGSGKSGYARVLKHACRARDQSEQVLSDAFDPNSDRLIPSAIFEIEISGNSFELIWERDEITDEKLSSISVFDSKCARSYLTAEQDVAYLPYGLDIVENLANTVLPEIRKRLDKEIVGIDIDTTPYIHMMDDTAVGKEIKSLSAKSKPSVLKDLSKFNGKEQERLDYLANALGAEDPELKAEELKISVARLKTFANKISKPLQYVGDNIVEELKNKYQEKAEAEEAEKNASTALQSGEKLLPGTGNEIWKLFFEAAKKYSTEDAYCDHEFPNTDEGAVCLLCQQPLSDFARDRFIRFKEYVEHDIAKTVLEKRHVLQESLKTLENADIEVGWDDSIRQEIKMLDKHLPQSIMDYEKNLKARKDIILKSISTGDFSSIKNLPENPRKKIRIIAATQLRLARTYLRVSDANKRDKLILERDELAARKSLNKVIQSVLDLLQRIKNKSALEECYKQLKTKPISDMSKDFANKAVTGKLKKALDVELKNLGVAHIKTKLKGRSDHGRMFHQLLLDLPTKKKVEEILSEGEQSAIAIAAFLAELSLANHSCGIVLDDPVSSLDHWRRKDVAKRLAKEALKRQVIIFTHDTTFLGQLSDEIEENSIPHVLKFLEWWGDSPGYVNDGLPWDHQGYKERIDTLEKEQSKIAKSWPSYPGEQESKIMRHAYDQFRATIERVIQDVIFCGVVKRYRDWIRVDKLSDVVGFTQFEYELVNKLHKHCSDVVTAHDPVSSKAVPVPKPEDLKKEIGELKKLVGVIKNRRKAKS